MNGFNRGYVKFVERFANNAELQFTLREMRDVFTRPGVWMGVVATVAVLVASGPAGTLNNYNAAERLTYWGLTVIVTFPTGWLFAAWTERSARRRGVSVWLAKPAGALVATMPVAAEVLLLTNLFNGQPLTDMDGVLPLAGLCLVVTLAITMTYAGGMTNGEQADDGAAEDGAAPAPPPFFKRLPRSLGTDLVSLQAQDHYVEVTTAAGRHLILMRLADAEAELDGYPGMRVHRSWWVARAAIDEMRNENGRPVLTLGDGTLVPVSRDRRAGVKAWLEE
ncbi:LytTR family DNA-binding domain-containing protein [Oricola sp.]|uniref:LytTR family DNA-binding domain-containing protein n=1 Tax=Oricola sp. TaxID=1979950 RepID=UPI003BA87D9E